MPLLSCCLFPGMFSLAPPAEPAALSSSHFPQSRTSWGWGMGSVTALADGFSSSLPRPPRPPRHLPSPLSSVSETPPGSWPEPPVPLGQQTASHSLILGHCHP